MSEFIDVTDKCSFDPQHGSLLRSNGILNVTYINSESGAVFTTSKAYRIFPREEFNSPYKISNNFSLYSGYGLFANCYNFNQPIDIPDGLTNASFMFHECYNFNSPVNIPDSLENCAYMCSDHGAKINNINIYGTSVNVCAMLNNTSPYNRVNIFCKDFSYLKNLNNIIGAMVMVRWTTSGIANCWYNESFNIYVYNNLV